MGIDALFAVLRYRRVIVGWSLFVGALAGVALALFLPTQYKAAARVQIDSIQRNTLTGLVEPRQRVSEYLGQQAAVAGSRTVALGVIDRLTADGVLSFDDFEARWRRETGGELVAGNDPRLWAADELLAKLTITAQDIESTLDFEFAARSPGESALIANAFANAYMQTVSDQKQRRFARKALSFSEETQALASDVESAQSDLQAYRELSGILPLGVQKVEAQEVELAALTARLAEARADEAEARSLIAQAEATPPGELINFPLPEDALAARQAQARLASASATLARIADRYGPAYPDYIEAAREKAALEANVLQSVRDRADYAARRVAALDEKASRLKAEVSGMQSQRERYDLLENKLNASQDTFNLVATRSLEESLQSRVDTFDVLLLARATPPSKPSTPPDWAIVLLSLAVGAFIGAAVAVFVEMREARVRDADALRIIFRTGAIGEVPGAKAAGEAAPARRRARRRRAAPQGAPA